MTHPMSEPWLQWKPIETFPKDEEGYLAIDDRVKGGFPQVVYWDKETRLLVVEDDGPQYQPSFFTHWARIPLPDC